MLKRIDRIKSCGIFEDYRWDPSLPDLARINVVFGRNGTGKTSLAGAIDGLRNATDGEGFTRVSVSVEDNADTRTTGLADDPIFDRIHVFSEHYVLRSHRFTPAAPEMDAVLTIGERPVDAEERLEELRGLIRTKTADRDEAREAEQAAQKTVDQAYRQVSQQVVDAASRAGGRWRSKNAFSVKTVRDAYQGSHASWTQLSRSDLQAKTAVINSDPAEVIPEDSLDVAAPPGIGHRLAEAIATTPSTIVLDTLATHPEATSWVDSGRRLHSDSEVCIFCGSQLSTQRRSLIDKHFSDELVRLQKTLQEIVGELHATEADVDRVLSSMPSKGLFFDDLRDHYDNAAETLRTELKALKDWSLAARGLADAKAENLLGTLESDVVAPPVVTGTDLIRLREEHNSRAQNHAALVEEAAKAVERHYLKLAEPTVGGANELASTKRAEANRIQKEIEDHEAEVATLENVDGDPMPSAKVLTEEVARLLGRNELKFEAVDRRYRVLRLSEPAVGLSSGERTAISLVHFLESVARFDAANGKPIVVIDDPVSSLDSDIFMGVSTYIWAETIIKGHVDQLILLTHNFELFRQWDIQLEGLHAGGKDKDTGKKLKDLYPACFYEIVPRHIRVEGKMKRSPMLTVWPPSEAARKKVRSNYHHAFISVATASKKLAEEGSLERRLDAQLLFPNVVRRMLETFLAFKRPEWVGNFNGAMRNSAKLLADAGYRGNPDALRLRLTRYAHAHSHDDDPTTDSTVSPEEVETAIAAVFEFMNQIDREHFEGLCITVGIEPSTILPAPPAEVD